MEERTAALIADLAGANGYDGSQLERSARRAAWLAELSPAQFGEFLEAAQAQSFPLSVKADRVLALWLNAAAQARRQQPTAEVEDETLVALELAYQGLEPDSRARGPLLTWLANGASGAELDLYARLLCDDPPEDDQDIVLALAPFFQKSRVRAAGLFPAILPALAHAALAAPVLDLANFLTREKLVAVHPAADRGPQLADLLASLVQSLLLLEENPAHFGDGPLELTQRVSRGTALAVSLCDALALIGDARVTGKLHQALAVRHRRIRTEAAAALARLGDKEGAVVLAQLAAEPVARLRVLAYAAELGLMDKIDPELATPVARAEAELAAWLAEPTQYGLPPTSLELFDQRHQRWPGYDSAVECFLFRFQYAVATKEGAVRSFSNIGIAGPLTHAFVADLGDLAPDDIYAAFAGWQAQHQDIREYAVERLSKSELLEVERLKRRLHDEGFAAIQPERMGYFFSDKALIATVRRQEVPGVAIADFQTTLFFPSLSQVRPLGAEAAYSIYKGRKLMRAFNQG